MGFIADVWNWIELGLRPENTTVLQAGLSDYRNSKASPWKTDSPKAADSNQSTSCATTLNFKYCGLGKVLVMGCSSVAIHPARDGVCCETLLFPNSGSSGPYRKVLWNFKPGLSDCTRESPIEMYKLNLSVNAQSLMDFGCAEIALKNKWQCINDNVMGSGYNWAYSCAAGENGDGLVDKSGFHVL